MIKAMHYNQFAILSLAELVVTNDTIGIVPFICAGTALIVVGLLLYLLDVKIVHR